MAVESSRTAFCHAPCLAYATASRFLVSQSLGSASRYRCHASIASGTASRAKANSPRRRSILADGFEIFACQSASAFSARAMSPSFKRASTSRAHASSSRGFFSNRRALNSASYASSPRADSAAGPPHSNRRTTAWDKWCMPMFLNWLPASRRVRGSKYGIPPGIDLTPLGRSFFSRNSPWFHLPHRPRPRFQFRPKPGLKYSRAINSLTPTREYFDLYF